MYTVEYLICTSSIGAITAPHEMLLCLIGENLALNKGEGSLGEKVKSRTCM